MSENLASRVGRIVSGSVNALVSAVEDAAPEVVMEEAIREIDAAADDARAELGKVLARKHLASTRLMDENQRHEDLHGKIQLALKEGREDLAEAAVSQQLDVEAQIPVLERTIRDCGEDQKEIEGFVAALQAKRREMHEALAQFRSTKQSAAAAGGGGASPPGGDGRRDPDPDARAQRAVSAFDRILERSSGVPAASGRLAEGAQMAELEDLARKNRVRERLAAAKANLESE